MGDYFRRSGGDYFRRGDGRLTGLLGRFDGRICIDGAMTNGRDIVNKAEVMVET